MKSIILSLLVSLPLASIGQTYKFTLTYSDGISTDIETTKLEVFIAPDKMAATFKEGDITEYIYADNAQKKIVELIDEDEEKEAYISTWETDLYEEALVVSYASEICLLPMAEQDAYRLLTETKVIQGLTCTKVELLSDGAVIGTGWLAKGVFIKLTGELGMFLTKDGSIVECSMEIEGEKSTCTLTGYSKTVDNPATAFTMNIPAGYKVIDETDYEDEEGDGE